MVFKVISTFFGNQDKLDLRFIKSLGSRLSIITFTKIHDIVKR